MKLLLLVLLLPLFAAASEDNPLAILEDTRFMSVLPTGSMRPAITERDWVFVKMKPFKDIVVGFDGDVIIIKLPQPVTVGPYTADTKCHRAVRKSSGGSIIITKGDFNDAEDDLLVTEDMYLGTVVAIVKRD